MGTPASLAVIKEADLQIILMAPASPSSLGALALFFFINSPLVLTTFSFLITCVIRLWGLNGSPLLPQITEL